MLRGFARVGGVLIGHPTAELKSDARPDFRDFGYEINGNEVRLRLRRADGREFVLGPYRKSIVHQALSYVADGRSTAVTMTPAAPLLELKVLLHPSFIDTPLGCRVIDIDRFVDEFTGCRDPRGQCTDPRSLAETRTREQIVLYHFAWLSRQLTVAGMDYSSGASGMPDASEIRRQRDEMLPLVERSLKNASSLHDPKQSLLATKPMFFDPELVAQMVECTRTNSAAAESFGTCVESKARQRSVEESTRQQWMAEPATPDDVSGVRELTFSIDPDLKFLAPPSGDGMAANLWPFEFMLQTAFPEPPAFLPLGEDPEAFVDREPWDFQELKPHIAQRVWQGLQGSERHMKVFKDVRELTVLQRLFRVMLEGGLGERLEIEDMIDLAEATGGSYAYSRTPRWNTRPGALEILYARRLLSGLSALSLRPASPYGSGSEWFTEVLGEMRSVYERILQNKHPELISSEEWGSAYALSRGRLAAMQTCQLTSDEMACGLNRGLTQLGEGVNFARALRFALDVSEDDRRDGAAHVCPPL